MSVWHQSSTREGLSVTSLRNVRPSVRSSSPDWCPYDGQMPVQDTKAVSGGSTTVTKYGVGPRGVDLITKKVDSGSESFAFPMYDVHGNMVATLARSGSSSYTTGNAQSFDVWGSVRSGSSTVDQKYCANLGHRSDSESGLQYMRARYYDPSVGRFVSEDPSLHGRNWFAYASNDPVSRCDRSGGSDAEVFALFLKSIVFIVVGSLLAFGFLCQFKIDQIENLMKSFDLKDYREKSGLYTYDYLRDQNRKLQLMKEQDDWKMRRNASLGAIGVAIISLIAYSFVVQGFLDSILLDSLGIDVFQFIEFE